MSYQNDIDSAIRSIDKKLDDVEDLLFGLPIRPGQKRAIQNKIYDLYSEIETAVEVSAVDYP